MTRSGEPTIKQQLAHLHGLAHENKQAQEFNTHLLRRILLKEGKIMTAIENLAAAVARIEGVGASVRKTVEEIAKALRNVQNNPEAQALADRLTAEADAIAASVEANPDPNPDD